MHLPLDERRMVVSPIFGPLIDSFKTCSGSNREDAYINEAHGTVRNKKFPAMSGPHFRPSRLRTVEIQLSLETS